MIQLDHLIRRTWLERLIGEVWSLDAPGVIWRTYMDGNLLHVAGTASGVTEQCFIDKTFLYQGPTQFCAALDEACRGIVDALTEPKATDG